MAVILNVPEYLSFILIVTLLSVISIVDLTLDNFSTSNIALLPSDN